MVTAGLVIGVHIELMTERDVFRVERSGRPTGQDRERRVTILLIPIVVAQN